MTLLNNQLWNTLEKIYGEQWRVACTEDTGYSYNQLWRMASGKAPIPLVLEKYLAARINRKRPSNGKKKRGKK